MTSPQELNQLADVVQAKYEQQQQRFAGLIARENQLRAELKRLDDMRRNTNAPAASLTQMKAIGADVLWLGWVGRSKKALNIQLAQILAQKEYHLKAVRMAYGKLLVVQEMRDDAKMKALRQSAQGQMDQAIRQSLQR